MQQGLYVPLPQVWSNLYDPVHVLLRAVHRRDFQSSMDRYTSLLVENKIFRIIQIIIIVVTYNF